MTATYTLTRDHPRGRGGNNLTEDFPEGDKGPSPRARGKLSALRHPEVHRGTIPAGAGET